jgi:hypothetical protein
VTGEEWLAMTDAAEMAPLMRYWGGSGPCHRCKAQPGWKPRPCDVCQDTSLWPRLSGRKLRLVACAACRVVWEALPNDNARRAVEAAERFAEGRTTAEQMRHAYSQTASLIASVPSAATLSADALGLVVGRALDALAPPQQRQVEEAFSDRRTAALNEVFRVVGRYGTAVREAVAAAEERIRREVLDELDRLLRQPRQALARAITDVTGDPTRPAAVPAAWLDANRGQARAVAQGIDADCRYDELPVLADALEEAGCDGARLLEHARRPGAHYRGCWLIDAALGKS